MPSSIRRSVLFPDADGPTTATASPTSIENVTPRRVGRSAPFGRKLRFSTASRASRTGSAAENLCGTASDSAALRRRDAASISSHCRRNPAIAANGISSRAKIMLAATMLPLLASPLRARYKPSATIPPVMPARSAFVVAEMPRDRSKACCTRRAAVFCEARQRVARTGSIPSATTASAALTPSRHAPHCIDRRAVGREDCPPGEHVANNIERDQQKDAPKCQKAQGPVHSQ